jgi:hypothetical protein
VPPGASLMKSEQGMVAIIGVIRAVLEGTGR